MPVRGSKPGERRGGRKKGTRNKTTAALKEAILLAAQQVGEDCSGRDGLVGYLRHVAGKEVKSFTALLGRVLPLQLSGEDGAPVQIIVDTGIFREDG
jgi:hypothetical protein